MSFSRFVGAYYHPKTKVVHKVVNPGDDRELYDPAHCENGQLKLLKIPRGNLPATMGMGDCYAAVLRAEEILSRRR